ncbi:amidohydrolase family protein [Nocardia bovistercoris]|uniref:Amidohydrolase n=1 Tax=Nocardia bovistercoris TaxID=2785916 RepID=A0A931N7L8_9NOCA|nr:amidohydrolase family protein [Nocardia bovistercoris]MBH0781761.1 amidohydrolase [Nocardia bovistercoris]
MSVPTSSTSLYPPGGFAPPKDRRGQAEGTLGLPAGTEVFSADNHISLAEDIFFERFPEDLKDKAPRVWYEEGAFQMGRKGKSFLPGDFSHVLMQYDPLEGSGSNNLAARTADLRADGIAKELAFPNALLALLFYPDKAIRELCFRTYNAYIAELQAQSDGAFYGVGLINWWDGDGARRTLTELKSLGLKTFLLPLSAGKDDDGNVIDYGSAAMIPVWEAIEESGIPVSHHIGESPLSAPCEFNSVIVGMMHNVAPFREVFSKYIFSGILDRHPGLQIGWFEGGINWVPAAIQDAEHLLASFQHMLNRPVEHDVRYYWDNHMRASFMVDPLGLSLIDQIGRDRVMWSSDYPHNESTFGYSEKSLATVVEAVGPVDAAKIVSGNIKDFLGV